MTSKGDPSWCVYLATGGSQGSWQEEGQLDWADESNDDDCWCCRLGLACIRLSKLDSSQHHWTNGTAHSPGIWAEITNILKVTSHTCYPSKSGNSLGCNGQDQQRPLSWSYACLIQKGFLVLDLISIDCTSFEQSILSAFLVYFTRSPF